MKCFYSRVEMVTRFYLGPNLFSPFLSRPWYRNLYRDDIGMSRRSFYYILSLNSNRKVRWILWAYKVSVSENNLKNFMRFVFAHVNFNTLRSNEINGVITLLFLSRQRGLFFFNLLEQSYLVISFHRYTVISTGRPIMNLSIYWQFIHGSIFLKNWRKLFILKSFDT